MPTKPKTVYELICIEKTGELVLVELYGGVLMGGESAKGKMDVVSLLRYFGRRPGSLIDWWEEE
jgi:hypothetical protein